MTTPLGPRIANPSGPDDGRSALVVEPVQWKPKIAPGSEEERVYLANLQLRAGSWPREELSPNAEKWTYAPIPLWLLQRPEVSGGAKSLYGRLLLHAGKNGRVGALQETLAKEIGVSPRSVRRLVAELVERKLIDAKKRGWGVADTYIFLRHPWSDLPIEGGSMPTRQKS